ALLGEHLLAIGEVAMPAHGDVSVAGRVEHRIALGVVPHLELAAALAQRSEEGGRVIVVVDVDDHGEPVREGVREPDGGGESTNSRWAAPAARGRGHSGYPWDFER